jgi:tRNA dimethylallyltransferase
MSKKLPRLLVVVGPTASGKTSLAIRLAKALGGEVVSADSRLLYKGMDVGTAKPSMRERVGVPHHLIDVVSPARTLTVAEYRAKALRVIRGILKRGKLPILAGGTGLYVRALVDNFTIPEVPPNPKLRRRLEKLTDDELRARLVKSDPAYAERAGHNRRYAIRALEVIAATGKPFSVLQGKGEPLFDALQIGLRPDRAALVVKIARRVREMMRGGLIEESRRLLRRYDPSLPSMSGIGYAEAAAYLRGEIGMEEAIERISARTRQYAKRQVTWFKRDPRIAWVKNANSALKLAKKWRSAR